MPRCAASPQGLKDNLLDLNGDGVVSEEERRIFFSEIGELAGALDCSHMNAVRTYCAALKLKQSRQRGAKPVGVVVVRSGCGFYREDGAEGIAAAGMLTHTCSIHTAGLS